MEGALVTRGLKILESVGSGVWKFLTRGRPVVPRKTLRLVPNAHGCWWHLGSSGDQPAMQVVGHWYATNVTDRPVLVLAASLLRPRVAGHVATQDRRRGVFGGYPIPPHGTADLSAHFWVKPPVQEDGKDFDARVEFIDQYGNKHRTKKVRFACHPRTTPKKQEPPKELVYSISDPLLKKIVSVLKAEVDRYRGCGRTVGGMGSVQTTVGGQTYRGVGSDWREADSPRQQEVLEQPTLGAVHSENADALLSIYNVLGSQEERERFKTALLDRLSRDGEYACIGYFIGLVLFRTGHLSDAVSRAKRDLFGDREFGFSNLLWLVDGLLKFEHSAFSDDPLDAIERVVHGVDEHLFRIPQRIAAVRALRLVPLSNREDGTE